MGLVPDPDDRCPGAGFPLRDGRPRTGPCTKIRSMHPRARRTCDCAGQRTQRLSESACPQPLRFIDPAVHLLDAQSPGSPRLVTSSPPPPTGHVPPARRGRMRDLAIPPPRGRARQPELAGPRAFRLNGGVWLDPSPASAWKVAPFSPRERSTRLPPRFSDGNATLLIFVPSSTPGLGTGGVPGEFGCGDRIPGFRQVRPSRCPRRPSCGAGGTPTNASIMVLVGCESCSRHRATWTSTTRS